MNSEIFVSLAILLFVNFILSAPIGYMEYGYLDDTLSEIRNENYTEALKSPQRFYITEVEDEETLAMDFSLPSVEDQNANEEGRYVYLYQPIWTKRDLTYTISQYSYHLDKNLVERDIQRAFAEWSKYTDFTFTNSESQNADIDIKFERKDHDDGNPFDGPDGVLAHAAVSDF
ncbi:unnamed protein product [Brassicogethes aeneus]|uniref:Peptidase M10 metallopeptidase domain-containing protein n=1 Tax=Brassicogethes aeneus TaxID=1431903 RepID=A0A9P0AUQ5_BRAAE|nr:unnamed protein product [Brassicogethes aeneus]